MSDFAKDTDVLISRQAAIDVADYTDYTGLAIEDVKKVTDEVVKGLKRLPSAQTERENGRWVIKDNPGTGWYRVTCSECGEDVTSVIPMIGFFPNAKALWDFCPDCGADMREREES